MAVEPAALRITELDFNSIRENLKNFLRSQTEFQDFDFDGSGMSVLIDILAYNTHYMGYYLNMVGNEMFLDTAQIRASVLSHAKAINYVPASQQGALSKVNIRVTPSNAEDQGASSLTLEKYTRFLGFDKNGVNYPFVTLYSNTATKQAGSFLFSNVYIKQGEVVTFQYVADATNDRRRYEIQSANVDTTTISVKVQESNSNTDTKVYTLASDITELTQNSRVYFIEENENLNYTFYFGDDVLGKRPKDGNIIICTYLDNVGAQSNNITGFFPTGSIGNKYNDNVRISSVVSSYGGIDKESIENVRFRAPYFYTTQNRAVTKNDYENLLVKDFNNIEAVSVWGGEENDPVIYGKVFISIKTKGNFELTNFEKENIKNKLIETRNVLTVTPEIIDADYVYILVKGKVRYNSDLTDLSTNDLLSRVKASIYDYASEKLSNFNSTFRTADLQNYILNSDQSITGSDIHIVLQKRVKIDTVNRRKYTINYNLPLQKSVIDINKLTSYPDFQTYDTTGTLRNTLIEEVPEVLTGIDSIQILSSGQNYVSIPKVEIIGDGNGATAEAVLTGGRITAIKITNSGTNYSTATVLITDDVGYGASATAKLQTKIGTLRSYYYTTDRKKIILNDNFGTIDYDSGLIILNSTRINGVTLNEFYRANYLTLNVLPANEIITPLRNRIVSIDENDPNSVQLQMVTD